MAVTGTQTCATVIEDALLLLEAHTLGQTVPTTQQTHALRAMGDMLKGWQSEHGTPSFLYAQQTLTLTTAASYTLSPARPLRILGARFVRSGIETPMIGMTRQEYDDLPVKTSQGVPTQYYYDRQREAALFYVWPVLSAADGETIKITYEREYEDIASASDTVDAPFEWYEAIKLGLAARLIPVYGKEATKAGLRGDAKGALDRALGSGVDGTSVYFVAGQ